MKPVSAAFLRHRKPALRPLSAKRALPAKQRETRVKIRIIAHLLAPAAKKVGPLRRMHPEQAELGTAARGRFRMDEARLGQADRLPTPLTQPSLIHAESATRG